MNEVKEQEPVIDILSRMYSVHCIAYGRQSGHLIHTVYTVQSAHKEAAGILYVKIKIKRTSIKTEKKRRKKMKYLSKCIAESEIRIRDFDS